jgi:diacylglycerol kinase (ATP)
VTGTVALLVNPLAGRGRAAGLVEPVRTALRDSGMDVRVLAGDSARRSTELTAGAVDDGVAAVVALGGDGLVHCALQAEAGSGVPLAIVPAGGGNDIAASLGLSAHPAAIARMVAAGHTRTVDLGRTLSTSPGAGGGRWWAGVLFAGFDSAVAARAERLRRPRGRLRYDIATWLELAGTRPRRMRMAFDGEEEERAVTLVAVGNGPRYGGGMLITPAARLDDGVFHVAIGEAMSRVHLARLKPLVRTGRHVLDPAVTVREAREVRLEAPDTPDLAAYADGERIGPLPVVTRCVPGALCVLVP